MFFDDYGLLNSRPDEKNAENAILWTMEYYVELKGDDPRKKEIHKVLSNAIELMRFSKGLYKQNPSFPIPDNTNHDWYMSHDQLTAIVCFFIANNDKREIKNILKEIIRQRGQYDNVSPNNPGKYKKRYVHPRDLAFYYLASLEIDDVINPLHTPLIVLSLFVHWITTIFTFSTKYKYRDLNNDGKIRKEDGEHIVKTDGKLLYRVKNKVFPIISCPINWFCDLVVKKSFGGWRGVYKFYFKLPQHPIHEVVS